MKHATGTELAAMRLALGVLRRDVHGTVHDPACTNVCSYAGMALGAGPSHRLLRARLALYLRARLRMERGDSGRFWAVDWTDSRGRLRSELFRTEHDARWAAQACSDRLTVRRARPLWEHARNMETEATDAG